MVNMVGFHHKEPVYNTAIPGEPGFYVHIKSRPTSTHPHRARVSTPTAFAIWNDAEEAKRWADHPGTFPVMVRAYLDWLEPDPDEIPGQMALDLEAT